MGAQGRVFVRGLTSMTYGLEEFRRRQLGAAKPWAWEASSARS